MGFPWQAMWARVLSLLALLLGALPSPASAEPLVRIRAESRIEIGVTHTPHETLVEGALRDELGAPLPQRSLLLSADTTDPARSLRAQVETDLDGHFAFELPEAAADYRLVAKFEGDDTHRGVRVERRIERQRADVRLEVRVVGGTDIDLDQGKVTFQVLAESDAGGDAIALRLVDGQGRQLGSGLSDARGRLSVSVLSSRLGEPGPGVIRVESLRDARRAEAQTESHILLRRQVKLSLWPTSSQVEAGEAIAITGRVETLGGPRAATPVGLFIDEQHIETVVTDAQGSFQARLWRDSPPGTLEITARTEADRGGALPEAQAHARVTLTAPQPLPLGWMLAALVGVLGPLLALARSGNGRAERALDINLPTRASIHPSRAHGRRDRHRVHGQARDALTEAPLPYAQVTLTYAGHTLALTSDGFGRFASELLPAGSVKLVIAAPGYVASETELSIPHRGEWSAFVVRLLSLREQAVAPLRRVASRLLPSGRAWGVWTTRETRDYLVSQHAAQREAIVALASEVERACYSQQGPSGDDLLRIEASAKTVERGLADESTPKSSRLR